MAKGRLLAPKLFIEGIEIPMESATFTSTVNQASVCYISLPSHQVLKDIKPRSFVQLFLRDFAAGVDNAMEYVLAWEGEVFGFEMLKSATGRTFRINCIDVTSYWDNVLAYFFNAQQTGGMGTGNISSVQAMETRDAVRQRIKFEAVLPGQASYFKVKMEKVFKESTAENPKDFLDAVISVYNDVALMNDFYAAAEERFRITERIKMKSSGNLMAIIKEKEALDWFTSVVGRGSGLQSLRGIINDLLGLIFHDNVTVPFPSRVVRNIPGEGLRYREDKSYPEKTTIGQFIFKPNLYMMPPPACNIFFPEEYSQFVYSRNFFEEPTRLIYSPSIPARDGSQAVALEQVYEPPAFKNFMMGAQPNSDFQKDKNDGLQMAFGLDLPKWHETDLSKAKEITNGKTRDSQYLSNEEMMKGIWMAKEGMMPSSSAFRAALSKKEGAADDAIGSKQFEQAVARYLFFKKRFEKRTCQVTSSFKMSVVPGYSCLILDDSDSGQNITAYVSSVTHSISASGGGHTQVSLSYARDVTEQDSSSNYGAQLLIPPWFAQEIFGENKTPPKSDTSPEDATVLGPQHVSTEKINEYFAETLGAKGSKSLTGMFDGKVTMSSALKALIKEYKAKKAFDNPDIIDDFIYATTSRDYIRCWDAMRFIGANSNVKNLARTEFVQFDGEVFTREGKRDEHAVAIRREVIRKYRDEMRTKRGFNG